MAKVKSKGTTLLMSISSVYTAIPQLKSLSISGEKSETFDTNTLDGTAFKSKAPTGYVEPCTISADVFYDPQNAVHQAFIALIAAPKTTNFKVTYADSGTDPLFSGGPTSAIYSGVGFGFDKSASPSDGLSGSMTIETSGAPS
jgi:hypothetical protein